MKSLYFTIMIVSWVAIFIVLMLAGCANVSMELPDGTKIKANSFMKDIDINQFYVSEPNTTVLVKKYEGMAKNSDIILDPLTKKVKFKTTGE